MEHNNAVIKKVCHSRGLLSGIYNACRCHKKGNTLLNNCVEDPRLRPSGMTPNLMGFTLIELLVVVLIIGILAAVAVPQYKVAVAKSRVSSILPIISTLEKAAYAYYWAHGGVTTSIHALDVDIPCTETFAGEDAGSNAGKPYWTCGKDFLVQLGTTGVFASYCPGHNGSYEDCNANRDYQVGYNYVSPIGGGDHYCLVRNKSSLGRSVCKALSI